MYALPVRDSICRRSFPAALILTGYEHDWHLLCAEVRTIPCAACPICTDEFSATVQLGPLRMAEPLFFEMSLGGVVTGLPPGCPHHNAGVIGFDLLRRCHRSVGLIWISDSRTMNRLEALAEGCDSNCVSV